MERNVPCKYVHRPPKKLQSLPKAFCLNISHSLYLNARCISTEIILCLSTIVIVRTTHSQNILHFFLVNKETAGGGFITYITKVSENILRIEGLKACLWVTIDIHKVVFRTTVYDQDRPLGFVQLRDYMAKTTLRQCDITYCDNDPVAAGCCSARGRHCSLSDTQLCITTLRCILNSGHAHTKHLH